MAGHPSKRSRSAARDPNTVRVLAFAPRTAISSAGIFTATTEIPKLGG